MKKILVFLLVILISMVLAIGQIKNPDKPIKGIWDFSMKELWNIENAGNEVFFQIREIQSDNKKLIYVVDSKLIKIHIFDMYGKYIKSFGKRGEGPGEIRNIQGSTIFVVEDNLIIREIGLLQYFTPEGKFIKRVTLKSGLSPRAFINKDQFISAPTTVQGDVKHEKIKIYNIKDESEKVIGDYQVFEKSSDTQRSGGNVMTVAIVIGGLTPMMTIHYHDGKVYYGMSDSYHITIKDIKKDEAKYFSIVDRKPEKVAKSFLNNMKKRMKNLPKEMVDNIINGLPPHVSFFNSISTDTRGYIYVFNPSPRIRNETRRKVDIFSPEGKYLYKAQIKINEGETISNTYFGDGFIVLALENEEGEVKIAKFSIKLPE